MMSNNIPQNTVEVSSVYTYKELSIDKLKHEYEITVSSDYIKQKVYCDGLKNYINNYYYSSSPN